MRNLKKWLAVAKLSSAIAVGVAVLALSATAIPAVAATADPAPLYHGAGPRSGVSDEYLAEALGITVEELQSAQQAAQEAAIQQALDEGLITQAQADALLERGGLFGGRGSRGLQGFLGDSTIDHEALLADALGVTVGGLQAAQQAAQDAKLAAAVESGQLTQEQADLMQAQQALKQYLDEQGLQDSLQALYEDAVQDAVQAGVITQEQADAILSSGSFHGRGDFGGRRSMRGPRLPGDAAPSGLFQPNGASLDFLGL